MSSHNVGVPALSIRNPDCHGYLQKVGNHHRTWRRRYCVLKYACLYYYIDATSTTAKGTRPMRSRCLSTRYLLVSSLVHTADVDKTKLSCLVAIIVFTPSTRQFCLVSIQFRLGLSRLDPVSNLQLIACSHHRHGRDKTVSSSLCRRCEQAIRNSKKSEVGLIC